MKANEFVKKCGIDSFKVAMICPQFKRYSYAILYSDEVDFSNNFIGKHSDYMFKTSEIKRLVESHELVSQFDDIEQAKAYLPEIDNDMPCGVKGGDLKFFHWQLEQAIADVESCQ